MTNQVPQEEYKPSWNVLWLGNFTDDGSTRVQGTITEHIDFIRTHLSQAREQGRKEGLEDLIKDLEKNKKEMLDKNDLDNYEAIYAITGFNDAISNAIELIKAKLESKESN